MTQHATPAQGPAREPTYTDRFPSDPADLPACRPAGVVELSDGAAFELRIGAGGEAARRRHRADAGLQRLDPRPDAAGGRGLGGRGRRRQRRRPGSDGALARAAAGESLRRHARDAGADPGRRDAFPSRVAFPDPGVYWYHPHIREDYGQEMGLYGNVIVVPADPDYWPPAHREVVPHARRRADRGRHGSRRSAARRRPTPRWAASATCCSIAGEPDLRADRAARRGRALLPDQHRQHPRVQGRAAGRADEARRRRQRPLRARAVRRRRRPRAVRARRASTCCSTQPGRARAGAPHPGPDLPARRDHRDDRGRGAAAGPTQFERLRSDPELAAERERLAAYLQAAPDKTLAFVAEMDFDGPPRARPSTPARCTPRSSARARPLPELRHEAAAAVPPRRTPARCTPRSSERAGTAARAAA